MTKNALSINFPIERAVLSDLSPYEVPIIFSNRHFYHFLIKHKIKHDGENFKWKTSDKALDKIILLILGLDQTTKITHTKENNISYTKTDISHSKLLSIAFTFPISHKHNQFRYLSIIHPKGQILAVNFYDKYKNIITYYSDLSPISLRSAKKVAGCTYIDSKTLIENFDSDNLGIEIDGQNYENLKSFFVYKKYRNIFEFYESADHHWCEKRFNFLSKLDVSSCFDSIYTHSISWAILQKTFAKKNLIQTKQTFAFKFDQLMQRINYNETNGILIGPELSRIFAEIILQSIDLDIISELKNEGLYLSKDYQIYRYVDDFFIFHNDENIFKKIRDVIQVNLKKYKLNLNQFKEKTYTRPIITPLTIAKKKIATLISDKIKYKIDDNDKEKKQIFIHASSLSTDFKSILSDSGVTYSDILNYSLAIIEKKLKHILKEYNKIINPNDSHKKQLINAIISIINFTYFIYSVSPKVNSTIKLCRIVQQIILFIKDKKIGLEFQHVIFKCIFDNSCSILEKYSITKTTPIETLYLLVLTKQLGRFYWLDTNTLVKYFNISVKNNIHSFDDNLNYFSITSLLFYISDKGRYSCIKRDLLLHIENIYKKKKDFILLDSELIHLTLDLISCPFIDIKFKQTILEYYNIEKNYIRKFISLNNYWFTKWNKFDFTKELDAKLSHDVY